MNNLYDKSSEPVGISIPKYIPEKMFNFENLEFKEFYADKFSNFGILKKDQLIENISVQNEITITEHLFETGMKIILYVAVNSENKYLSLQTYKEKEIYYVRKIDTDTITLHPTLNDANSNTNKLLLTSYLYKGDLYCKLIFENAEDVDEGSIASTIELNRMLSIEMINELSFAYSKERRILPLEEILQNYYGQKRLSSEEDVKYSERVKKIILLDPKTTEVGIINNIKNDFENTGIDYSRGGYDTVCVLGNSYLGNYSSFYSQSTGYVNGSFLGNAGGGSYNVCILIKDFDIDNDLTSLINFIDNSIAHGIGYTVYFI